MQSLQILMLAVAEMFPCSSQPRKSLSREELDRMVASVAARGILHPIRVRRDENRGGWEIVTGETRWRAAKEAGLATVPCIELTGELSETDLLADQLIENVVRNDLKPMELARGLAKYQSLRKITAQAMAAELGISGGSVTKAAALLSLPDDLQALVNDGSVCPNAAYEISRLPDAASQRLLAQAVAEGKVNREAVTETVQAAIGKRNVKPKAARLPLRFDGISITVSADQPLTWDGFNAALDRLRRESKKLFDQGKALTELPKSLRPS